ncbi:hypothetical protein BDP81DRAFT_456962 [Colletotrichum phormii]|uniref:Fasciclin domain family protein n=1 Tax=Colletotrichum phormii TaxID=359342 RepID=A0AAJ0A755_9PEZI|nr:uncharacterized protein BDP81DRAFT_456962 [Colletotrichum phormii]KAK1656306.1 hypothetical protein BDP81DRAFT_456962 [Colletotrichum phormii]
MIFPASQASSHFPLEPVSAAVLCSRETKRRGAAMARGKVQVGSRDVDEEVLGGGFERGSVVGLSSESEQMGILISMQALAKTLCGDESGGDRGKGARVMIVTTQPPAAILPPLRDAIRTELVVRSTAEADADLVTRLRRCLERVSVSRVFDLEGLWQVLGDLDIPPESPEPRVSSSPPGFRAPSGEKRLEKDDDDAAGETKDGGVVESMGSVEVSAEDAAISSSGHTAPELQEPRQPVRIVLPELKPLPQPTKSTRTEIADSDDEDDAISLPSSSSSSLSPPPSTIRSPTPFTAADSPERADEEEVTEGAEENDLNNNLEETPDQVTKESHEEKTESRPPGDEIPDAIPAVAAPESRSPENDSKDSALPDIILITHFHSLMTALFTRRDRQSAHDSLQHLSSHLRYISRTLETSPLIMLLNSTSSSKESTMSKTSVNAQGGPPPPPPNGGETGTSSSSKAVDPTLRSIFNPPALNITGYGYGGNQAASRRNKPTFGLVFSQLLDLHLLCTKIPRDKEDAERLYTAAPGGIGGGGEDDGVGVRFVWALEVLLDEIGVWEHETGAGAGAEGKKRGARKSREQRWGVVDVRGGRVVDAFETVEKKVGEIRVVGGFGGPRV